MKTFAQFIAEAPKRTRGLKPKRYKTEQGIVDHLERGQPNNPDQPHHDAFVFDSGYRNDDRGRLRGVGQGLHTMAKKLHATGKYRLYHAKEDGDKSRITTHFLVKEKHDDGAETPINHIKYSPTAQSPTSSLYGHYAGKRIRPKYKRMGG